MVWAVAPRAAKGMADEYLCLDVRMDMCAVMCMRMRMDMFVDVCIDMSTIDDERQTATRVERRAWACVCTCV